MLFLRKVYKYGHKNVFKANGDFLGGSDDDSQINRN